VTSFLSGAIMMGCFVAATFFWRSWLRTTDRLFIWFALSFLILGVDRLAIVFTDAVETTTPWVYLMRVLAFALIAIAIIDKNRR
jgi:uncharacterized membrane protein